MPGVFVTNGQLRKSLAVVRALGSRGIPVYIGDTTLCTPAGFSRFCTGRLRYPDPKKDGSAFCAWLAEQAVRYKWDMIYPMDDDTMEAVLAQRETLSALCALPIPSLESYQKAADKGSTVQLAMDAGVPCPKTLFPRTMQEVDALAEELDYPVVVKPRKSSGSRGIRKVLNSAELRAVYRQSHLEYPWPLIQEFLQPGLRLDVCFLYAPDGRLTASFVQKELRHFPMPMGPSTAQESVLMPELIDISLRLMEHLPWTGVVELEYMIDQRDGKAKFMEINPRYWNSLYAATLAGVDFPWLMRQAFTGKPVEPVHTYQTGIRCRSTLPADLLHKLGDPRRWIPGFLGGARYPGETDDIMAWNDPGPVIGFCLACLRYMGDLHMWKFFFKR